MSCLSVPSLTPLHSMKCTESEDEEPAKGKESQLQLSCFINQEVKYLATGLRLVSSTTATHTGTCTGTHGRIHTNAQKHTGAHTDHDVSKVVCHHGNTDLIPSCPAVSFSRDCRKKSPSCPRLCKEMPCT